MLLQLKNIKKNFTQGGEVLHVLEDVNLEAKSGEIISLVGPSGSGKSTLIQIAGLLDAPSSGQVILDGEDCAKLSDKKRTEIRKNKLGFVYQFHHLLPEFTALENIIIPQMIAGVKKADAHGKAADILMQLGLGNRLGNLPSELSGGEQQRVAIARALINKPKLLFADEPTGNLDPEHSGKVLDIFLKEVKSRKLTAIIVTHNLELAKKTDRVLTIANGRIKKL